MRALILAGGFGKRMGALKKNVPKVMLPVAGRPLLEHLILHCREYDIKDIILSLYYQADIIRRHFGDGRGFGVHIVYREEENPRGSGGALDEVRDLFTERMLVMNGDLVHHVNIHNLLQFHHEKGGIGTLVVHPSDHPYDSDMIVVDQQNKVKRIFRPKKEEQFKNCANAGIFVFEQRILSYVQPKGKQSMEKDVLPKAVGAGESIYAYATDEYIKDIGTPQRYREVNEDFS